MNKGAKDLIKIVCENYANIINDTKKYYVITKIYLDDNVYTDQII